MPKSVSKRELYKKFGRFGYVTDIFISRKIRQNSDNPFAFIRFGKYQSAMDAIKSLNEMSWEGEKLFLSLLKFRRETNARNNRLKREDRKEHDKNAKKVVKAVWSEEQKSRLERSLLGVCVKPIEFRKVMNLLLDEWKGPGDIECRDVGPYRCLITFSSPEIRDEALNDKLRLFVFDEVRHHWGLFWCLSRRV
ncbi:hypothetical protein PIB30_023171 [Stylosanthes scabra]|uniref:RRM domain-containing protein n=1 Tax=Stylosanthes scabra TaxID=79078 RepID=A0ABU6T934_9FABA|nr:hypothetical protein [Stylosanthes scabra]